MDDLRIGAKIFSALPIALSSNRAPNTISRSASSKIKLVLRAACIPNIPKYSGCVGGIKPNPINVIVVGRLFSPPTQSLLLHASEPITPPLNKSTGFFAWLIICAAWITKSVLKAGAASFLVVSVAIYLKVIVAC